MPIDESVSLTPQQELNEKLKEVQMQSRQRPSLSLSRFAPNLKMAFEMSIYAKYWQRDGLWGFLYTLKIFISHFTLHVAHNHT